MSQFCPWCDGIWLQDRAILLPSMVIWTERWWYAVLRRHSVIDLQSAYVLPKQAIRNAILGACKNKMQLNRLIAESLLDPDFYISATQKGHSLTLAGVDDVPVEIKMRICVEREDLASSHEEADPIIIQHATSRCMQGEKVRVVSDDTDVFLLLLYFCLENMHK